MASFLDSISDLLIKRVLPGLNKPRTAKGIGTNKPNLQQPGRIARDVGNLTRDYYLGNIQRPVAEGVRQFQRPGLVNKGLGAAQVGLSAFAPLAAPFQAAAGAARSARTGQPFGESVRDSLVNPSSIAREGLGIKNPVLSLGVDVLATRNPKAIIKDPLLLKKGGQVLSAAREHFAPTKFPVVDASLFTKDAFKQVQENGRSMLDTIKRFDLAFRSGLKAKAPPMELSNLLRSRLETHYKQLYGNKRKIPANIYDLEEAVRRGFDEFRIRPEAPSGSSGGNPPFSSGLVGSQPQRVPQTFRTDKFNVGEQEAQTLSNLQKSLGLESRTVRSFDDMRETAEALGTEPQKLLRDIQNGRITDSEVIALGNLIGQSTRRIASLQEQIKQAPYDSKLLRQLEAEEALLNRAIRTRIKGGTEAGRSVAAFRVIANQTMDPAYWLDKAKRQIGEEKDLDPQLITAINEFITNNDRLGLARFVSKLGESNGWEKAITLWKAGLLTGFKTTIANVGSNAVFAGLETAKDIPATAFDIARAAITGGQRTKSLGLRNVTAQPGGFVEGSRRLKALLKGEGNLDELAKAEIRRPIRFGKTRLGRFAQRYTETVFGIVGGTDKPFYQMAYRRSLADQAGAIAANTGKSVDELMSNPTEEMLKIATKDAAYATFTNPNSLTNFIKAGKQAGGPVVSGAFDLMAPFTRTPTNVGKATFIDYTPVGFAVEAGKTLAKVFKGQPVDERALAEAFGRSTTGSALLALGVKLAEKGLISGPWPASESERSQWELEGKTPNSILINGKWRSMGRFSPAGGLVLLGAGAQQSGYDPGKTALTGLKGFSEQSFLRGVSSGLQSLSNPERYGSSFAEGVVSGSIPTLASDVARGLDTYRRDADGFKERTLARIPGAREELPTKLNALGEPVEEQGGLIGNLIDPANSRTPSSDPLVGEFSRVGYNLNYVGDSISNQKLTREQEREYQRLAGSYIRQVLEPIIPSAAYQELSIDQQRDVIEKAVNAAKAQARDELADKLPEIADTSGQVFAAEESDTPAPATPPSYAGAERRETTTNPFLLKFEEDQAREKVRRTGEPVQTETSVYYQDGDSVRQVQLEREIQEPKLTGSEQIDKKLISRYKSQVTAAINDVVTLVELGIIDVSEGERRIDELQARFGGSKSTTTGKGRGSGGVSAAKRRQAVATFAGKIRQQNQALPRSFAPRSSVGRVASRTLGIPPRPRTLAGRTQSRVLASKQDIDELIRRYSSR